MIWTKKAFIERLNEEKKRMEDNADNGDDYAKGYIRAINDVLTMIESEGGCFREE